MSGGSASFVFSFQDLSHHSLIIFQLSSQIFSTLVLSENKAIAPLFGKGTWQCFNVNLLLWIKEWNSVSFLME